MTQLAKIYSVLRANRKQWVSIRQLHQASGSLCVSTKISELRKKGLDIENRQKRQDNGVVYSRYKLNKGVLR